MPIVTDSEEEKRKIRSEIINCYRIIEGYMIHGWRLEGYMQVLGGCRFDVISKVLGDVLRTVKDRKFPPPGYLLDEYTRLIKRERSYEVPRKIETSSQTDRSLRTTVMSHMYLHYNNGWDVSDAQCIKEVHEKLCPGEPYRFERILEKIPRSMVDSYMASKGIDADSSSSRNL